MFGLFILVKKPFAFILLFGLGYVKTMRNKYKVNLSIQWMSSQLYLLYLVYFFLKPHSSPQAWTNILGRAQNDIVKVQMGGGIGKANRQGALPYTTSLSAGHFR